MLLVASGLTAMFAIGGLVGLQAIDDAGDLVFQERLATAYATVAIVERHFGHLASDVYFMEQEARDLAGPDAEVLAEAMLDRVAGVGRYTFFTVTGLDVLDATGAPVATAGLPAADDLTAPDAVAVLPESGVYAVDEATWRLQGEVPLADFTVPLESTAASNFGGIRLHAVSVNSTDPFSPAEYAGRRARRALDPSEHMPIELYNLEIVDSTGTAVLSLGTGSQPGSPTAHRDHIADVVAAGSATALVDPGDEELGLGPHVVAAVPMVQSPFYLLLEQPIDVALSLPNQLRERLFVLIGVGFTVALTVAWVTTRRVVKPTEELTRAASRMAQGDLTQAIDVAAYDEVASLAETLELMRERLLKAQSQLLNVNRDLERRIEERTARLGFVLRKTISAQEDERHALARELHDETAQTIGALTIALGRAREDATAGTYEGLERIKEAEAIAARLLAETRRLIMGLRPSVLDDLGLGPAIAWYGETAMSERERDTDVRVDAPRDRMPRHLEVALFRIAQEALNNVAKHSHASKVTVSIVLDGDQVELTIEDDGVGFDADSALTQAAGAGGVGLAGMQERVALLGGSLTIASEAGGGAFVRVTAPIAAEDR